MFVTSPNSSLVERLRDEADLCRNETATDIANLLDEAAAALSAQSSTDGGRGVSIASKGALIFEVDKVSQQLSTVCDGLLKLQQFICKNLPTREIPPTPNDVVEQACKLYKAIEHNSTGYWEHSSDPEWKSKWRKRVKKVLDDYALEGEALSFPHPDAPHPQSGNGVWQPIESVPNNTNDVLVFHGDYIEIMMGHVVHDYIEGAKGGKYLSAPTHWMNLPAPPTGADK